MSQATGWRLLPWFVVRQAGFPFAWLSELASAPASASASRLLRQLERAKAARRSALDALRAAGGASLAHAIVEKAGCCPEPLMVSLPAQAQAALRTWNDAVACLHEGMEELAATHEAALLATARRVVSRFRGDVRLTEVLLLSNEASFDVLAEQLESPGEPWTDRRRLLDTLVLYLQRVCAKNETHSHFGPITLGCVERRAEPGLSWAGDGRLERAAFCSHWVAEKLAARVGADPTLRPWLIPRLGPGVFLMEGGAEVWGFRFEGLPSPDSQPGVPIRFVPLDTAQATLVAACDGRLRVADLAAEANVSADRLWPSIQALAEAGVLAVDMEPPVGRAEALRELRALLPAESPWVRVVDELQAELSAFAAAPRGGRRARLAALRGRLERLTGARLVRGLGRAYADRGVLYEECRRLDRVEMGGALARGIESDLAPVYDLYLVEPRRRLALERRLLADWFAERWGARARVSVHDYLLGAIADQDRLEPRYRAVDAEVAAARQALEDALVPEERADEPVVEVSPELAAELAARHGNDIPAVCNPDVCVVAPSLEALNRGELRFVLGECHVLGQELTSHTSFSHFMRDSVPHAVLSLDDAYRALVAPDEVAVDVLRGHADKTYVQLELRCPDLEVEGRSPKPRESVLALRDLEVHHGAGGLRLYAPRLGRFVRTMTAPVGNNQLPRNPFRVFGFPRRVGGALVVRPGAAHLPRIVVGRAVAQRRMWRIAPGELAGPLALGRVRLDQGTAGAFLRLARLREERGLPRLAFARIPGEPKPVFVDLESPLLVRQLGRLGGRATGPLELTEMLPGPDDLWLTSPDGCHTTELRLALFSVPC
jgi:Lantibiotic dehydratase, N terminus